MIDRLTDGAGLIRTLVSPKNVAIISINRILNSSTDASQKKILHSDKGGRGICPLTNIVNCSSTVPKVHLNFSVI